MRQRNTFITKGFLVLFVDAADVANDVREQIAIRIKPLHVRSHFHSGKAEPVHRETCNLLFVQALLEGDNLETP